MKLMIDLNIMLDVLQKREPFREASAAVISFIVEGKAEGFVPAHAMTTLYYVLAKYFNHEKSIETIEWMLKYFSVARLERETFVSALSLSFRDFEDAVVAASAEIERCDYIITRNTDDFKSSKVKALAPIDFLEQNRP